MLSSIFRGRRGLCMLPNQLISFFFFFEGRPVSTVGFHPAGSQVRFFDFWMNLKEKGEGAQNLSQLLS